MKAKPLSLAVFAAVSLAPLVLFGAGIWLGGLWIWSGFAYMAGLAIVMDQLIPMAAGNAPEDAEFPMENPVLVAVGLGPLALLPAAVWAIGGDSGFSAMERVGLFLGCGYWLGQVAHPAAHELIHRTGAGLYRLGVVAYAMLLIGHHASAHRLVHHRAVATPADPNSAPAGMGFWRFLPRAWAGSFRAGLAAESARRARVRRGLHPYAIYGLISALSLMLGWLIAGPLGAIVWAGLAFHAQIQLFLADYVQHYGLVRRQLPDGRYEPVGVQHAWNSAPWFSSALTLNAPRHSDHHTNPQRGYPALRLGDQAPLLPWPLPLSCVLALSPRLWRRAMKRPLAQWQAQHGMTV